MKRILVLDDLAEARALLDAAVAGLFPDATRHHAGNLAEARALTARLNFDLALVDLGLPDGDGAEFIAELTASQPDCVNIVATIFDDDDHLFAALGAGAQGYLLKDAPPERLRARLAGIADGQPPLSPAIARRLLRHFQSAPATPPTASPATPTIELSPRERETLALLARGLRIAEIAGQLGISRHTAGDHIKNIYRKLNISTRAEAALRARGLGLA